MSHKFLFVLNDSSFFISHRLPIGLALLEQGHEVHIVAPGDFPEKLKQYGFIFHSVNMSRNGKNPFHEAYTIWQLYKIFRRVKPNLVHLVTIKPYLYGGIAARLAKVPAVVSAVAGLGTLFIEQRNKYRFLRGILYHPYKFAFGHCNQTIIFQNNDDREQLKNWLKIDKNKTSLIKGSGVDLMEYTAVPEPTSSPPVVAMASRLLKDKGTIEFIEACKLLIKRDVKAEFWLIGEPDLGNSNSISLEELEDWRKSGIVKCLGYRADIAHLFSLCNIVVLPSYREGLPRVLVEAAACGRAVITTDVPGCRDAIINGVTGSLVPVREHVLLADAMQFLVENEALREEMGIAGRKLAEEVFSIEIIVRQHLDIYQKLLLE